jgi:hypothetical protein
MAHARKLLAGCLVSLWGVPAGLAHAQIDISADEAIDGTQYDDVDESGELKEHPRGSYTGVAPGGDQPPALPAKPGEGRTAITWPGFQMRPDGTSRFFIQSTKPLVVNTDVRATKIVVDLARADIVGDNTRLPLETRFFNTPVTRATVVRTDKSTQLVLELRAPAQPQITSEQAKSGFYFLYLDFPAGQFLPTAETKPSASSAPAQPTRHVDQPPLDTSKDDERPPGMGKVKATGSASGSAGASSSGGKAKAKADGKAKAGFSL